MSCCSCEGSQQEAVEHVTQARLEALEEEKTMEISIDLTEMPQVVVSSGGAPRAESPNGSQVHLSLGLRDASLMRATSLVEILRCGGSALRANSLMAPGRELGKGFYKGFFMVFGWFLA